MSIFPNPTSFDEAEIQHSASFQAWAGGKVDVLSSDEITGTDFSVSGPFVVRAYHGTTHDFREFDARNHGNPEGQFGAMNYFTTSYRDAATNYGENGPDLESRIETLSERMVYDIEQDPEAYGAPEFACYQECLERAHEIVRGQLIGPDPKVIEVYLRFDRPFVVGSQEKGLYQLFDGERPDYADFTQKALADRGYIEWPEDEDTSDIEAEIEDEFLRAEDEYYDNLQVAFMRAAADLDINLPDLDLSSALEFGTHDHFEKSLRDDEKIHAIECHETGALISSHFIARVIFHLGYDAIILMNSNDRFSTMAMESYVTHIHIFPEHRSRIKSVLNQGNFNPASPDIYS